MISVYAIECHVNGCAYVGYTVGKIGKRMREHRCLLNQGSHTATRMVRDWQRFGSGAFSVRVLEALPPDATVADKRKAETKWMNEYDKDGRLYNPNKISFTLTPEAIAKGVSVAHDKPGNRWTPEANLKRRLAQLGKPKGHGAKISAPKRARQGT